MRSSSLSSSLLLNARLRNVYWRGGGGAWRGRAGQGRREEKAAANPQRGGLRADGTGCTCGFWPHGRPDPGAAGPICTHGAGGSGAASAEVCAPRRNAHRSGAHTAGAAAAAAPHLVLLQLVQLGAVLTLLGEVLLHLAQARARGCQVCAQVAGKRGGARARTRAPAGRW